MRGGTSPPNRPRHQRRTSTTDDFTRGLDALVYHRRGARGLAHRLPDRPVRPQHHRRRFMLVSFLTLAIGSNPGMGDIDHAKADHFYRTTARHPDVRRPGQGHRRPVAHPRTAGRWRRLHRGDDLKPKLGLRPEPFAEGGLPVLRARRFHQERHRATRSSRRSRKACHWSTR